MTEFASLEQYRDATLAGAAWSGWHPASDKPPVNETVHVAHDGHLASFDVSEERGPLEGVWDGRTWTLTAVRGKDRITPGWFVTTEGRADEPTHWRRKGD